MSTAWRAITCPVLVDRDYVVEGIRRSWAADPGGGGVLLVSGEMGMGKTRLIHEVTRIAGEDGAAVVVIRCAENSSVPFDHLRAALRPHLRHMTRAQQDAVFEGAAAPALPLVMDRAGGPGAVENVSPSARDAAVVEVLHRLASGRPLLVVVEDLHWASVDTIHLLETMVASLDVEPMWLVVTHRPPGQARPELPPLLLRLRRRSGAAEVSIGPLTRDGVARMVRALLPAAAVTDDVTAAVAARAGGNPLFVEELCAAVAAAPVPSGDTVEALELPATLRTAVLDRAAGMDPGALDVLRLAAVAGDRIDSEVLTRAGVDGEALAAAVEAGLDHDLLARRRANGETAVEFRHAMTRHALAEDIGAGMRVRAHRRLALAFCALDRGGSHAGAAADHLEAAGDTAGAHIQALEAARASVRNIAPEDAAERYMQAARLNPAHPLPVLLEGAEALLVLSAPAAKPLAEKARTVAAGTADELEHARALLVLGQVRWFEGAAADRVTLVERAAMLLRGRADRWEARALSRLVLAQLTAGSRDEAARLLPGAIELASAFEMHADMAELLACRADLAPTAAEMVADLRSARHEATLTGSVGRVASVDADIGWNQVYYIGDLGAARQALAGAIAAAQGIDPDNHAWWLGIDAMAAALQGRSSEALRILATIPDRGNPRGHARALDVQCEVLLGSGDHAAAALRATSFVEAVRDFQEADWVIWARSAQLRSALSSGWDGARAMAEDLLALQRANTASYVWRYAPDVAHRLLLERRTGELDEWVDATRPMLAAHADGPHQATASALCEACLAIAGADNDAAQRWLLLAETTARDSQRMPRVAQALELRALLEPASGRAPTAGSVSVAVAPSPDRADPPTAVLRREGDGWAIDWQGATLQVRHVTGLDHLARLIERPGVEIHAMELALAAPPASPKGRAAREDDMGIADNSGYEALDQEAVRAYRERLLELRADVEQSSLDNDIERASRGRTEIDFLVSELARAVGLGGRARRVGSDSERARVNVTRALRSAIARIERLAPALGSHLRVAVQTGTFCSYTPDPLASVHWRVQRPPVP